MEERIRFITHKGQPILLVDLSNCSPEEVAKTSSLVPSFVQPQPRESVLVLADLTDAKFDKDAVEAMKKALVFDRPHLKRSAWFGAESLPKVFYENLKAFSQRSLPTFKTREEALDWLVSGEAAATG